MLTIDDLCVLPRDKREILVNQYMCHYVTLDEAEYKQEGDEGWTWFKKWITDVHNTEGLHIGYYVYGFSYISTLEVFDSVYDLEVFFDLETAYDYYNQITYAFEGVRV